jgi:hypothetical protein
MTGSTLGMTKPSVLVKCISMFRLVELTIWATLDRTAIPGTVVRGNHDSMF